MTPDMAFVLGIILAVLSVPTILSAMSDRRAPRAAAISLLIAGGLIFYAIQTQPGGYSLEQIPEVFARVIRSMY